MNMFKSNGGFTLVELIVVIAILAILAGVAVPAYSAYIKSANNSAVATELENISTAATLANAKAGGVSSVKVEEISGDTTKLLITVSATSFDEEFSSMFMSTLNGKASAGDDTTATDGSLTFKYTMPSTWNASDYNDDTLTWNNNSWPKPTK